MKHEHTGAMALQGYLRETFYSVSRSISFYIKFNFTDAYKITFLNNSCMHFASHNHVLIVFDSNTLSTFVTDLRITPHKVERNTVSTWLYPCNQSIDLELVNTSFLPVVKFSHYKHYAYKLRPFAIGPRQARRAAQNISLKFLFDCHRTRNFYNICYPRNAATTASQSTIPEQSNQNDVLVKVRNSRFCIQTLVIRWTFGISPSYLVDSAAAQLIAISFITVWSTISYL